MDLFNLHTLMLVAIIMVVTTIGFATIISVVKLIFKGFVCLGKAVMNCVK